MHHAPPPRPLRHRRPPAPLLAAGLVLLLVGTATPTLAQNKKPAPKKPPVRAGKSAPGAAIPPPPGFALYNQALSAAGKGNLDTAIRLCRQVVKEDPDAAAAWATLAQFLSRKGRDGEALAAITKATTVAPDAAPFWGERANIEAKLGRLDAAIASGKKALAKDPKNDPALAALATAYLGKKQFADAVPVLRRLSAARGGLDMAVGQNLVLSYLGVGDLKGALEISKKLAAKFAGDYRTHLSVADLCSRLDDFEGAYAAMRRARRLAPKDPVVGLNTALAAEMLGKRDEALALLAGVAKLSPKSGAPWFHRGRLLYGDESRPDRLVQAERAYDEAVKREPTNALYQTERGMAQLFQGPKRADDARTSFQRALLVSNNRNERALFGLALLGEQAGDWKLAAAHYGSVLEMNPANHQARRRRAGALRVLGRKDESYREFWELATRNPKNTLYLKELGSFFLEDRRPADARAAYSQVLERAPGDVDALLGTARTYELQGDVGSAERQYRAAIAANPREPNAYRALVESLARRNRTEERLAVAEQWLAVDPASNEARWERITAYRDLKRDDEALAEMRKLTLRAGDPNRMAYRLGPAALYAERGKWDLAAAEYEKVLAEEPNEDAIRYPLALAYDKTGRFADAEKLLLEMERKAGNGPNALRPRTALGALYERAKRWDDAQRRYEEVLATDPRYKDAREGLRRVGEATGKPDLAFDLLARIATASPQAPNLEAALALEQMLTQEAKTDYEKYVAFARGLAEKYPDSTEAKARAEKAVQQYGGGGTAATGTPPVPAKLGGS